MANPIPHTLNEANGHIKATPGLGTPLPIQNFRDKSIQFNVGGAGDYNLRVSNDKTNWITINAASIVVGTSLFTNEEGSSERLPHKIAWLVVETVVFNSGDEAHFLGEDAG